MTDERTKALGIDHADPNFGGMVHGKVFNLLGHRVRDVRSGNDCDRNDRLRNVPSHCLSLEDGLG